MPSSPPLKKSYWSSGWHHDWGLSGAADRVAKDVLVVTWHVLSVEPGTIEFSIKSCPNVLMDPGGRVVDLVLRLAVRGKYVHEVTVVS